MEFDEAVQHDLGNGEDALGMGVKCTSTSTLFKKRGDVQSRHSYREVKLWSYTVKMWKRAPEEKLRYREV